MEDEELDVLLSVLENPIRRRIVKRLSQGSSYALQLAKELSLGQPLVAKHLEMMEGAGVVTSSRVPSETGPHRKTYSLVKSISITLDMAPNLFIQRGFTFGTIKERELSVEDNRIMSEASRVSGKGAKDISTLSQLLQRVDGKLEEIEDERAALLYIRNKAMESAAKALGKMEESAKRRVAYNILDEHDRDVRRLSEDLDLRESVIRDILREMGSLFG